MAPFKLAIIGAGPSAFYVASRLLSLLPYSNAQLPPFKIHMYDRLWAPHGLARYGVAPDHPEVKNCTKKFDSVAEDPRFRFFGNVHVDVGGGGGGGGGEPPNAIQHELRLPLTSVRSSYTHLLFSTGCGMSKLHPSLSPSSRCVPALSLVHWYTHHPSRPPAPPLDKISHITLIGNGNVSLDIARMLLIDPSLLSKHDLPESVLDILSHSSVRHVSIVGRRGPLEAAFTTKELREMMNLENVALVPLASDMLALPSSDVASSLTRQQTRIMDILRKGSKNKLGTTEKTWSLEFFRSPIDLAFTSTSPSSTPVALTLAHTKVDPTTRRAVPTGETSTLDTSFVVTSLGFHADPTIPFYDPTIGHLRTNAGRVISPPGTVVKNVYASGWTATGAKGVLAATMLDAYNVAESICSDWMESGLGEIADGDVMMMNPRPHPDDPPLEVLAGLEEGRVMEYGDWKAVDAEEVRRGKERGKERERMGWEEASRFLAKSRATHIPKVHGSSSK